MAGDWIKMRNGIETDPAVIYLAEHTDCADEDHVVGKLKRFWSWCDEHTVDGNAPSVTLLWVDRYLGTQGFAQAMVDVGWLERTNGGFSVPHFDRHNGKSAKQRALTAIRAKQHRNAQGNAGVTQPALPREEKRRVVSTNVDTGSTRRFKKPTGAEVKAYCQERKNRVDPEQFVDHYEARGWKLKGGGAMKDWRAAIRTWERNNFAGGRPQDAAPSAAEFLEK